MELIKSYLIDDKSILNGLNVLLYADGSFKLVDKNGEINNFIDNNGFVIYYLNRNGKLKYFFKHDIAKKYLLNGNGDYIIYKDNNYRNVNINNLKKCTYQQYREHQINLSKEYEKKQKNKRMTLSNSVHKGLLNEGDKFFQVILPNGQKIQLKKYIPIGEKIEITNKLLEEWYEVIVENWNSVAVKCFLDRLASYLVWHIEKDEIRTRNGEILSKMKSNRLNGLENDFWLSYFEEDKAERKKIY